MLDKYDFFLTDVAPIRVHVNDDRRRTEFTFSLYTVHKMNAAVTSMMGYDAE